MYTQFCLFLGALPFLRRRKKTITTMMYFKQLIDKIPWEKASIVTLLLLCPVIVFIWTFIIISNYPAIDINSIPLAFYILVLISSLNVPIFMLVMRYFLTNRN